MDVAKLLPFHKKSYVSRCMRAFLALNRGEPPWSRTGTC